MTLYLATLWADKHLVRGNHLIGLQHQAIRTSIVPHELGGRSCLRERATPPPRSAAPPDSAAALQLPHRADLCRVGEAFCSLPWEEAPECDGWSRGRSLAVAPGDGAERGG